MRWSRTTNHYPAATFDFKQISIMGRTFFKSSKSIKDAIVGFAPMPGPGGVITTAAGTTVAPAVITLDGIWSKGDIIDIEITTNIPVTTNTITSSQLNQTSEDFAVLVAIDLSLETNITAVAVGPTIEIVAADLAVSLLVDSVTIS